MNGSFLYKHGRRSVLTSLPGGLFALVVGASPGVSPALPLGAVGGRQQRGEAALQHVRVAYMHAVNLTRRSEIEHDEAILEAELGWKQGGWLRSRNRSLVADRKPRSKPKPVIRITLFFLGGGFRSLPPPP